MAYKTLLVLTLTIASVLAAKNYGGYKVYKVTPNSQKAVNVVQDLFKNGIGEFWEEYFDVDRDVRVMVAPDKQSKFQDQVRAAGIKVEVIIDDLQRTINKQMEPVPITNRNVESLFSMNWTQYHDLDTIYAWLDELQSNYPDIVSTHVMGHSVENREIKGIIINYSNATRFGFLEGTLHSREWIATAVVTWTIKEFLTSTDPEVRALAENFEWHIFPMLNPDGYVYTFQHNRMWRKNRSTASFTSCSSQGNDDMSNGVDLNRNFDHQWMSIGASQDPCTNTYAGPSANSEPETQALTKYVEELSSRGNIIYYLAYHSYTQLIVIPYSHLVDTNAPGMADNYDNMYEIAKVGAEAIGQRYNTTFRYGISADIMYPMSGTSFDWVKETFNVPVCFLIELRDRGLFGEYGFLLPPGQIIPSGLETMDGLLAMDRKTRELGYYTPFPTDSPTTDSPSTDSAGTVLSSVLLMIVGFLFAY